MSKLNNIQLLRALAASFVVLYHSCIESTSVCTATGMGCVYEFWMGGLGVPLFFMISGFIMVVTSWDHFTVSQASWDFLKRRLLRIVPLYWLVTTIAVIGVWFVPAMLNVAVLDPAYVASSYLFWPVERVNGLVRPIANLGWTLNLEMMFYAVFSVALLFGRRRGLEYCIFFLLALVTFQVSGIFKIDGAFASVPLNFWGDPIILNFIFGMLIGAAYRKGIKISGYETVIMLGAALILGLATIDVKHWFADLAEDAVMNRLYYVPSLLVLFAAAALGPQLSGKSAITRIGLLIGDASYSLYLIHPFVLRVFTKLWTKAVGTHLPVWCFTLLCVAGALAAGLLLYGIFERPMNRLFARMKRNEGAKAVQTVAVT